MKKTECALNFLKQTFWSFNFKNQIFMRYIIYKYLALLVFALFPLIGQANSRESEEQLELQCVLSLCGTPENNPTTYLTNLNFDQFISPRSMETLTELESTVRGRVERGFAHYDLFMKSLGEFIKKNDHSLDISAMDLADALGDFYEIEVDKEKPPGQQIDFQPSFPPAVEPALKELVEAIEVYIQSAEDKANKSFSDGLHHGLYSLDEAQKILDKYWKEAQSIYQNNASKMHEGDRSRFRELKEQFENEPFKHVYAISDFVYELEHTLQWHSVDGYQRPLVPPNCNKKCREKVKQGLTTISLPHYYQQLKKKGEEERKTFANEQVAYCQSIFAMNFLQDYELGEIEQLIPDINNSFLERVFPYFSTQSRNSFAHYLTMVEFTIAPDSDWNKIDVVRDRLRSDINPGERNNNYSAYRRGDYITKLLPYIVSGKNPFYEQLCDEYGSMRKQGWGDRFQGDIIGVEGTALLLRGKIEVSRFSSTHHRYGRGIISHEVAHALSFNVLLKNLSQDSSAKYKDLRSCVTNPKDRDAKKTVLYHEGDKLKTEEDLADILSYIAEPDPDLLVACNFFAPSINGKSYHPDYFSIKKYDPEDTHSPSLVRLIREVIYKRGKGELPLSCKKVMDINKERFIFDKCLI